MNLPKFVKWADEDIIRDATNRIIKKYTINGVNDNIDISNISFEELRDLATVVSEIGFNKELYNRIPYETQNVLKNKLNEEFNLRIGDVLPIYNLLDKELNKEKWGGEERYKLLALHNRKGYSEMGVLKNSIWFMKLKGKEITIESAEELSHIMSSTLYWEFGFETCYKIDAFKNKENFNICNEGRKLEINAQNNFVKFIFDNNIDAAYKMIEKQVLKHF